MSRTNYIFVDFENVQETDWERIVGKPVKVVLVLGKQQWSLPLALVAWIQRFPTQVEILKTTLSGKNALDLVLAERLGEIRAGDPTGSFHIISKDNGFDALIAYLNASGTSATRCSSISALFPLTDLEQRIAQIQERLKTRSGNRPKQARSLERYIQTALGRSVSGEEVSKVIQRLAQSQTFTLLDSGEVKYAA